MGAARVAALYALMRIVLKGSVLLSMVLAVSVPVAVATIFLLGSNLASQELSLLATTSSSTTCRISQTNTLGCTQICITSAEVVNEKGEKVKATVISASKPNEFLRYVGCKLSGEIGTVFGEGLARVLGVRVGDNVVVCSEGLCQSLNVSGVCRGGLSNVLVLNSQGNCESIFLCCLSGSGNRYVFAQGMAKDLGNLLHSISYLVMIAYVPLIYLTVRKICLIVSDELRLLNEQGLSLPSLRTHFSLAVLLIATTFTVYGVSLGLFVFNAGLWVLRFFNIFVPFRASLDMALIPMVLGYAALTLPFGYYTIARMR